MPRLLKHFRPKKLLVFLLLGAIINVAVAWSLSLWSSGFDHPPRPQVFLSENKAIPNADFDWLKRNGWQGRPEVAWRTRFVVEESRHAFGLGVRSYIEKEEPNPPNAGGRHLLESDIAAFRVQAGWPIYSLAGAKIDNTHPSQRVSSGDVTGYPFMEAVSAKMISAFQPSARTSVHYRLIPCGPILPGFAINTVFYAAILWLLIAAPFKLRRYIRTKRQRCPACGYPVGTSPVCTECGVAVMARSVGPPTPYLAPALAGVNPQDGNCLRLRCRSPAKAGAK